jgi:hypothetical protein
MAIPVQMPILLKDDLSQSSARMLQVSDRLIELEGNTDRVVGQKIDFSFSMVGFDRALQGRAVVEKVIDPELGRGRCTLRILEIEDQQRTTFLRWLYELAQGGGQAFSHCRQPSHTSNIPPVSAGAPPSTTTIHTDPRAPGKGRAALRGTLSRHHQRGQPAADASHSPRRRRVDVMVAPDAQPALVKVRFNDPSLYVKHYRAHLCHDALELRYPDSGLREGMEVGVRLFLPNGKLVGCQAKVSAVGAKAFALQLQLEHEDRSLLERSATWRRRP